ncbi:hypothetical protein KA005_24295 [bacterium]|nr:hypothetical protein [bacterium]
MYDNSIFTDTKARMKRRLKHKLVVFISTIAILAKLGGAIVMLALVFKSMEVCDFDNEEEAIIIALRELRVADRNRGISIPQEDLSGVLTSMETHNLAGEPYLAATVDIFLKNQSEAYATVFITDDCTSQVTRH